MPPEVAGPPRDGVARAVRRDGPVLVTSSATRQGLDELARELLRPCRRRSRVAGGPPARTTSPSSRLPPAAGRAFEVERTGAGGFRVAGEAVERLVARFDIENEEAQAHVERRLQRMGVIAALEREGFEPGDDVEIGGIVFELDPGAPL